MTKENDIVLIYFEDNPLAFARIEDIAPDIKKDWYHVKLLILQIPLQTITWILKDSYISGAEFTMNEKKIQLERVVCPKDPEDEEKSATREKKKKIPEKTGAAKIISLADLKKK